MKIRADFVTNSSSSSFVAYGIYDEEIKKFVMDMLKDEVAEALKQSGKFYSTNDEIACFELLESGISIDSEIGDLEDTRWLNINMVEEYDYTNAKALGDGRSLMKTVCVVDMLKRFMRELSDQEEKDLKKLIDQTKKNKLIEDKVYFGSTEDGIDANTFNEKTAKRKINAAKREKAKREASIKVNIGFNIVGDVLKECLCDDEHIVIPDGIKEIGAKAFMGNTSIKSVEISGSVTTIGSSAFNGCENLESVTIPSNVKKIGNSAFKKCKNLTQVTLEEGIEEIGSSAFSNCKNLSEIVIPNSVIWMENQAFASTGIKNIHIPYRVEGCAEALKNCKKLESITVDDNNTKYCSYDGILFSKDKKALCKYPSAKKEKTYEIPDGIEKVMSDAFSICQNLKSIKFPKTLNCGLSFLNGDNLKYVSSYEVDSENMWYTSIDGVIYSNDLTCLFKYPPKKSDEVFEVPKSIESITIENNDFLKKLILSDKVEHIHFESDPIWSFKGLDSCKKLKTIELPYCLNYIAEKIGEFYANKNKSVEFVFYGEKNVDIKNRGFKVDNGTLLSCKSSSEVVEIPEGVVKITSGSFEPEWILTKVKTKKVVLPQSIRIINSKAFYYCKQLEEVFIPQGVEFIGCDVFFNCNNLKTLTLPKRFEKEIDRIFPKYKEQNVTIIYK